MGKRIVFSLLVDNEAGVLSRIAGLFSRRSYNIESLTVGETENPAISRMTVVAEGDEDVLEQIQKQVDKLIDVKFIKVLPPESSVCRELILMKIAVTSESRQQLIAIVDIFRAKIVDVSPESVIVELTGTQSKIDAFTNLLGDFKVLELARTGITGLTRGWSDESRD